MFKLLILLAVVALSSASNYDRLFGGWTFIAATTDDPPPPECNEVFMEKTETVCNCDGKNIPEVVVKGEPVGKPRHFVPILLDNVDEVDAALKKKPEGCSCGGADTEQHVMRVLSDNYLAVYIPTKVGHETVLLRRAATSKSDFEKFVKSAEDFKDKKYIILCDVFSS